MKRTALAIALSALAFGANADPIVVTIDDFNGPDVQLDAPYLGAGKATSSDSVRDVSYWLTEGPTSGPIGSSLTIGSQTFPSGLLEVANASGRNSIAAIDWTLNSLVLPSDATDVSFFLEIVESDGNPTALDFYFDGASLASFSIPGNTLGTPIQFALTEAQVNTVSAGGELTMEISGATGWDLTVDLFGLSYNTPGTPPKNDVPEPGTLALIGLAIAGLGFTRRRRQV